jgi:hypothetical protein
MFTDLFVCACPLPKLGHQFLLSLCLCGFTIVRLPGSGTQQDPLPLGLFLCHAFPFFLFVLCQFFLAFLHQGRGRCGGFSGLFLFPFRCYSFGLVVLCFLSFFLFVFLQILFAFGFRSFGGFGDINGFSFHGKIVVKGWGGGQCWELEWLDAVGHVVERCRELSVPQVLRHDGRGNPANPRGWNVWGWQKCSAKQWAAFAVDQ